MHHNNLVLSISQPVDLPMSDREKSKEQLVEELESLRQEVSELKPRASALDAQSELLNNLVVMARSTAGVLMLKATLQKTLDVATRLTGAQKGSLFLLDEEGAIADSILARGEVTQQQRESLIGKVLDKGLAGWVLRHQQVGAIADTLEDDRWLTLPNQPYTVRSALGVPIIRGKMLLGLLTLMHSEPGHFSTDHIHLMEVTADQMALSLENARLYSEREQAELALKKANEELEIRVEERTVELREAIKQLQSEMAVRISTETSLRQSEMQLREQATQLEQLLHELQRTQTQLVQTEKMSSLGLLVSGIAHEINNPVNSIHSNLPFAKQYVQDLIKLLHLYAECYPDPKPQIQAYAETIDLDFTVTDLLQLLNSMKVGAERIYEIIRSLRNFSRIEQSAMTPVDIHEGLDSTLLILRHRLRAKTGYSEIQVIKEYGDLSLVECYAGQLNQVFMNIISNAIDALEEYDAGRSLMEIESHPSTIWIRTKMLNSNFVQVQIADNGPGMSEEVRRCLFDPFFTTKSLGKGTGLGMSISYQIVVEKHGGELKCISAPSQGACFLIEIPVQQHQEQDIGHKLKL